eukprot:scaffold73121_cov34-Phaeocystis_antarctica.AAC.2
MASTPLTRAVRRRAVCTALRPYVTWLSPLAAIRRRAVRGALLDGMRRLGERAVARGLAPVRDAAPTLALAPTLTPILTLTLTLALTPTPAL